MTDDQVLSDTLFPFQRLDCYRAARELAALVHRAAISDPELRDQATRAAKSAFLNLCEGLPDDRPAMRRKYFAAADGSLHETVGAVDLSAAIGRSRHAPYASSLWWGRTGGSVRGSVGEESPSRGSTEATRFSSFMCGSFHPRARSRTWTRVRTRCQPSQRP